MALANASMALSKSNGGNLKLGFNRFSDQLPLDMQSILNLKSSIQALTEY